MITQTIRILFFSILFAPPLYAFAGSVQEKLSGELALITGTRVNLRAEPSLSANVIMQLPIGYWIKATNDIKRSGGHSWRRALAQNCLPRGSAACMGWIAEDHIALVSSFVRVTEWKEQFFTDRLDGDGRLNFHLRPDGTVTGNSGTGVILRKDRFVLLRFGHTSAFYPSDDGIYYYYSLYVMDEANRLCRIDDGVVGSGGLMKDMCTRLAAP